MKFEVDGVNYEMVESPTFGEARAIEKITGKAFSTFGGEQSVDLMQALVWISMRRTDPDITFESLDDLDIGVLAPTDADEEGQPEVPTVADADSKVGTTSAFSA